MSFASFPEQRPVVDLLQKSLSRGRLAHGYLFTGEDPAEMEALARTLAKTLNCSNPPSRSESGQQLDSCDACLNCRRIDSLSHPDVQWLRPESKSRQIRIDPVRDLIQIISLKPTEADYKVAIITAADRMNAAAANAFLKTLEEPPARSILILLTCSVEQVLETVLSRCLRLHFAGASSLKVEPDNQAWLESLATAASQQQKSLISRYRLLSLITARLAQMREEIEQQMEANSPIKRYPDVEKDFRDKWEAETNAAIESEYRRKRAELLLLLQWWLRDIWISTLEVESLELAVPQVRTATAGVAQRISPAEASENLQHVDRLQRQLNSTNVQETLALEISLLKLRL